MSAFWSSVLGPVAFLTVGASLLMSVGHRLPPRWRHALPAAVAAVAILFWIGLRLQQEQPVQFWAWRGPIDLTSAIGVQLSGWSWLAGFMILIVGAVGIRLPGWQQRPGFIDARLWSLVLVAASLLVVSAATWITLLLAWTAVTLIAGLLAGDIEQGAQQAWVAGVLSSLFLLMAMLFNGGATIETDIASTHLNSQAQLLLVVAAVFRLGAYPFHVWLGPLDTRAPGRQLVVQLTQALSAFYLLGRLSLPLISSQAWVPMIAVALLGSALSAWTAQESRLGWLYIFVNRSTWALLVIGIGQLAAPNGAILPLVSLGLAGVLWGLALATPHALGRRLLRLLALAVIIGLPLTPSLSPNLILAQLTNALVGIPIWLLVLLSQTLLIAALVRQPLPAPAPFEVARTSRSFVAIAALMVGLTLWWGLSPASVARLAGAGVPTAFPGPIAALTQAGLAGLITLAAPLVLGVFLGRNDEKWFGSLRGWQDRVAAITSMNWVHSAISRGLHDLATVIGLGGDLVDGAGQFGWALLILLLVWTLLSR